jgi:hypothetical protein
VEHRRWGERHFSQAHPFGSTAAASKASWPGFAWRERSLFASTPSTISDTCFTNHLRGVSKPKIIFTFSYSPGPAAQNGQRIDCGAQSNIDQQSQNVCMRLAAERHATDPAPKIPPVRGRALSKSGDEKSLCELRCAYTPCKAFGICTCTLE